MTTKRQKAALLLTESLGHVDPKNSGLQNRNEAMEQEERRSAHQPKNNRQTLSLDDLKTFDPLTENQKKFYDAYNVGDYFMGAFGSPGTGKTFVAMYKALEEVLTKGNSFKQVVVVRSAVQTRDQGHVPGTLEEKQAIFEQPYVEICATLFGRADAWHLLKQNGQARFITTTAIRGISVDDAVIVTDECQSMTFHELDTVMSRTGYRSKIIFCGDMNQNDLVKNKYDVSGLLEFMHVIRQMDEFTEIRFTVDDIVRSSLVKNYIIAKESLGIGLGI
jgi:phosphate starvation-inducible protein PhoH